MFEFNYRSGVRKEPFRVDLELLTIYLTSFTLNECHSSRAHFISMVRHKENEINNGDSHAGRLWFYPNYKHTRSQFTPECMWLLKGRRRTWPACILVLSVNTNLGFILKENKPKEPQVFIAKFGCQTQRWDNLERSWRRHIFETSLIACNRKLEFVTESRRNRYTNADARPVCLSFECMNRNGSDDTC